MQVRVGPTEAPPVCSSTPSSCRTHCHTQTSLVSLWLKLYAKSKLRPRLANSLYNFILLSKHTLLSSTIHVIVFSWNWFVVAACNSTLYSRTVILFCDIHVIFCGNYIQQAQFYKMCYMIYFFIIWFIFLSFLQNILYYLFTIVFIVIFIEHIVHFP